MADGWFQLAQELDAVSSGRGRRSVVVERPYRVLAWPDYESVSELRHLFHTFGRLLAGQPDVGLCLMHVDGVDPNLPDAVDTVRRVREEVLGGGHADGIRFLTDESAPDTWPDLGRSAHAVLALPSSSRGRRRAFQRLVDLPVAERAVHLLSMLNGMRIRTREGGWRLPAAPARHGLPTEPTPADSTWNPDDVWRGLGFCPHDLDGRLIVDMGCGPRLRTSWFDGARIEAVEPRAEQFAEHLWWNDLSRASVLHESPLGVAIPALEGRARLVVLGDGIATGPESDTVLAAAASYLAPDGELILRAPRTRLPAGLRAWRAWMPRGADEREPFTVCRWEAQ